MSEPTELIPSPPAVRNTSGKGSEQVLKDPNRHASDAALREYCDKYYHQLLPIIAKKVHHEKVQQEKLKEVKARLNFEGCSGKNSKIQEVSQHSESRTPNVRGDLRRRLRSRRSHSTSRIPEPTPRVFSRIRCDRSQSPRNGLGDKGRMEGGILRKLPSAKCIKDLVEIHHIKQREGESIEDFVQRFKTESRHVKGALECMRISRFKHGITNPELIKRLHDKILKSVDAMMRVTIMFLTGEVAASNQAWKKTLPIWKQQEAGRKQNFDRRGDFRNQLWPEVKSQMVSATAPLNGFSRKIIWPMGQILLPVKINDAEHSTSTWMNFVIVRSPSPYNGIIWRPGVRKIQCTVVSRPEAQPADVTQPAEERIKVAIPPEYPKQTIAIGSTLTEEGGSVTLSGASAEHPRRIPSSQTKEKKRSTREEQGNSRGSRKTCRRQHHKGSPLPQLVIKSGNGKKARQQLEDVCGLQRPK
ncbi:hypothetical protein Tco_0424421 [Tanacetum coccineum]